MFRDSHKLLRRFLPAAAVVRGIERQENSDIKAELVTLFGMIGFFTFSGMQRSVRSAGPTGRKG